MQYNIILYQNFNKISLILFCSIWYVCEFDSFYSYNGRLGLCQVFYVMMISQKTEGEGGLSTASDAFHRFVAPHKFNF